MDCRNYKDLLDSYLSQELAVETNHAILRHAEQCKSCREEMAARRSLRDALRRACLQEKMSESAGERLRSAIRVEAVVENSEKRMGGWRDLAGGLFPARFTMPAVISVALIIIISSVAGLSLLKFQKNRVSAAELSAALIDESTGDHRTCAAQYVHRKGPLVMPAKIAGEYPAYSNLQEIAGAGAVGLELRSVHVCGYRGRKFAHLVYLSGTHLVSLLVTERDARALRLGRVPDDDGRTAGLQKAALDHLALDAYQSRKYIVVVVSQLPVAENLSIAEKLSPPVIEHLRQFEKSSIVQKGYIEGEMNKSGEMLVSLRGGGK